MGCILSRVFVKCALYIGTPYCVRMVTNSGYDMAMEAVRNNPHNIAYVPEAVADEAMAIEAVRGSAYVIQLLPQQLCTRSVVLAALDDRLVCFVMGYVHMWHDREVVLKAVSKRGYLLAQLDDAMLDDYDVVMAGLANYGEYLGHVSKRMRSDPNVVLAALRSCGSVWKYVPREVFRCLSLVESAGHMRGAAIWLQQGAALVRARSDLPLHIIEDIMMVLPDYS